MDSKAPKASKTRVSRSLMETWSTYLVLDLEQPSHLVTI